MLPFPAISALLGTTLLIACGVPPAEDDTAIPDTRVHAVLLVIDNSSSMRDGASSLAIADLPGALTGKKWRLDITTTSVEPADPGDPQPGDGGTSVLSGASITSEDPDPTSAFRAAVLCQATCFSENDVPTDPNYVCDATAAPDEITQEYLDCICGVGTWAGHCGSGNEMGLEAAELALCGAAASAPAACYSYDEINGGGSVPTVFAPGDELRSDLLQGAADVSVLIVSDEGDGSYRQVSGDSDSALYAGLFAQFGVVSLSVVGPWYEDGAGDCLDGAQPWSVERYQGVAAATGGAYLGFTGGPDTDCAPSDMGSVVGAFVGAI